MASIRRTFVSRFIREHNRRNFIVIQINLFCFIKKKSLVYLLRE